MDFIVNKLVTLGLPKEIVDKLADSFWDKLSEEIKENGIKKVCEKIGIDPAKVPDIDIDAVVNIFSELSGKDADGDGKTGVMEALDMAKGLLGKK